MFYHFLRTRHLVHFLNLSVLTVSEPPSFRGFAPAAFGRPRRSWCRGARLLRAADEGEALVVGRLPLVVMGTEGESLFVVGGVGEQCPSGAGVVLDLCPQGFSDPGGGAAEENTGGDLQKPAGQEASQTDRAGGEDNDGHQMIPSE